MSTQLELPSVSRYTAVHTQMINLSIAVDSENVNATRVIIRVDLFGIKSIKVKFGIAVDSVTINYT